MPGTHVPCCRHYFSKVRCIVALFSKYDGALTERNPLLSLGRMAGDARAIEQLCRLHFEGLRRPGKGGEGPHDVVEGFEEPNYEEAHKWGFKAYQKGVTVAGYYLGIIYEQDHAPRGVDHALAKQWFLAACQKSVHANQGASAHAEPPSAHCDQAGPADETVRTEAMVGLGRCYYKGGTWDANLSVPDPLP